MFIAITQRHEKNKYGDFIDSLENDYTGYFTKNNFNLVPLPNNSCNIESYFKKIPISHVILSGGNDINPGLYGGKNDHGLSISDDRDATEKKVLDLAIKKKLPVLGICRGMQFINVYFGGRLHLATNRIFKDSVEHIRSEHNIRLIGNKIQKELGTKKLVNSYHNSSISLINLAFELRAFALTKDDIVEGLYHPEFPIVGIQWHPGRKTSDDIINKILVKDFLEKKFLWRIKK